MYEQQPQFLAQIAEVEPNPVDQERARRLRGVVTQLSLRDEKVLFEETRCRGTDLALEEIDRANHAPYPSIRCMERLH